MDHSAIIFEERAAAGGKKIGIARLNQPKSLNALSLAMIRALTPQLQRWRDDDSVAAVWLEGSGDKAFCAGGDIVFLYEAMVARGDNGKLQDGVDFFTEEYELDHLLHRFPKPVIVWGNGIVMGGGLGLLAAGSHRVATESARIAMPEVTIGLYPDVGASWFLNKMPGRTGLFIGLTGIHLNAEDARFVGLADRCIHHEQRDAVLAALCADPQLAEDADPCIHHHLKAAEAHSAGAMPPSVIRDQFDTIQELTDEATLGAVVANITGYQGDHPALAKAAKTLAAGSPTSIALIWRQFHASQHLSLAEVFAAELHLSIRCLEKGELAEGIRALLIDKDRQPRWRYASLESLDPEWIDSFYN
ncbi:enoyl-CoA hydratase/isomerase family protein [Marinobacter sp. X15-166B]|uniref:enoyl-CoA hydratase/isomerase family protein n=1 Tax=Marinobacter sp. X15-166B TaxID=1897620 RepID=UPI00085CCF27|nr:enoyl-CoA hydratase/isomerase family protein [Marinobacter sp. X15-166B]OEY66281.1 enoyl-CoA hydratase [Marinobacter sp. X15-166B]